MDLTVESSGMIEPSAQERADLPETSNNYICDLEDCITLLESEIEYLKSELRKNGRYIGTLGAS